jgi:cell division protein FtsQ
MRKRKKYQIKRKKSLLKNRIFWTTLLIVSFFGSLCYLVVFSPVFQINALVILGNERLTSQEIQQAIWPKIENEKQILGFKTKSIFLAEIKSLKSQLLEQFLLIDELKIKKILPKSLVLEIKERKTLGVWCWENNCFNFDKKGIIFENQTTMPENALTINSKQPTTEISLGKKAIDEKTLSAIVLIQQTMAEKAKITANDFTSFENDGRLNAKTTENWEAYFDLKGDVNWQLVRLELLLDKTLPLEKRQGLEYIDLRFSKIFYK